MRVLGRPIHACRAWEIPHCHGAGHAQWDMTDAPPTCQSAITGIRIGTSEDKLPVNRCPVSFAFITRLFYHVVAHIIHMYVRNFGVKGLSPHSIQLCLTTPTLQKLMNCVLVILSEMKDDKENISWKYYLPAYIFYLPRHQISNFCNENREIVEILYIFRDA